MEELLKQLLGKKIDVTCGTNATFRGDVVDVKTGVLYLRDEEGEVAYVAIDKVAVIYECKDPHTRPGFIASAKKCPVFSRAPGELFCLALETIWPRSVRRCSAF